MDGALNPVVCEMCPFRFVFVTANMVIYTYYEKRGKKLKKSLKKVLTKKSRCGILTKLSARERCKPRLSERMKKEIKKLLKNHLTNSRQCDIIVKSPESDSESQTWSLKIEQQRDEVQSE